MPETLSYEESLVFALRDLYQRYGYRQFKVAKLENYSLYADKKDYLFSEKVITFTDTDGSLKALKPDVTLSVVCNVDADRTMTQKLFYCENVYRVSQKTNRFDEQMQVGLEVLGSVDAYAIAEVAALAVESLRAISDESLLVVSNIDVLARCMEALDLPGDARAQVLACVESKNVADLQRVCKAQGVSDTAVAQLISLMEPADDPRTELARLADQGFPPDAIAQLASVVRFMEAAGLADALRIDCSRVMDTNYYNGIVFEGFVAGVPSRVLSGGQYDKLMAKMDKSAQAIGFAVYVDIVEQYFDKTPAPAVDVVLLYGEADEPQTVFSQVQRLTEQGKNVLAATGLPSGIRYSQVLKAGEIDA